MDKNPIVRRPCPVCGGTDTECLFRQRFQEIEHGSLLAGYDVVVCKACGLCFAEDLPEQQAFDHYYHDLSKYEHQSQGGQASEFESRQFPALASLVTAQLPDKDTRILEIGCANGGLLHAIKSLGYANVLGVDPSPVCARNAEQLYGISVLTASISELKPELGPFDFIILVAVLEHIRDLDQTLQNIGALLAGTGLLYVEVPDATRFAESPDAPFQEFSVEHINFFTASSLGNLMSAYGFESVSIEQAAYDQTDTHTGFAIRMIFRKKGSGKDPVFDPSGRDALMQYIAASQRIEDRIHGVVNSLVISQDPLIVWGVGTHTQRLLATSDLAKANITAFVDSNPNYQGKRLLNKSILAPAELGGHTEAILVSSRIFQSEIVDQIRSVLHLQNQIHTLYEA